MLRINQFQPLCFLELLPVVPQRKTISAVVSDAYNDPPSTETLTT